MLKQELWLPGMREDSLIVPEYISDFLEILIPANSTKSEWDEMVFVNKSGIEFMNGELDIDTYMDILDSVGIDPQFHLREAAWQVANLFNY
ncbi:MULTISPECIES: hypothetical protein [unclassified Microcoleus]|uniref:hypothetical protein n=1 Tax=unclassified Microcoleus TaxID=2642155 RepID=UPI002FD6A3B8